MKYQKNKNKEDTFMKLLATAFLLMISSATFADTKTMNREATEKQNTYPAMEDRFGGTRS